MGSDPARLVHFVGGGRAHLGLAAPQLVLCRRRRGFLVTRIRLGAWRYHSVRLGQSGEKPEYKVAAWLSMVFAAATGVGTRILNREKNWPGIWIGLTT